MWYRGKMLLFSWASCERRRAHAQFPPSSSGLPTRLPLLGDNRGLVGCSSSPRRVRLHAVARKLGIVTPSCSSERYLPAWLPARLPGTGSDSTEERKLHHRATDVSFLSLRCCAGRPRNVTSTPRLDPRPITTSAGRWTSLSLGTEESGGSEYGLSCERDTYLMK